MIGLPVDILFPAALENQITADTAGTLRARIVAEGTSGPTMPEADDILVGRDVTQNPHVSY